MMLSSSKCFATSMCQLNTEFRTASLHVRGVCLFSAFFFFIIKSICNKWLENVLNFMWHMYFRYRRLEGIEKIKS